MQDIIRILTEIQRDLHDSVFLQKEIFSLQQFCKYADISEEYGYKLTSERKVNFSRPGGKKIYINRQDAIAYLQQNPVKRLTTSEQEANNYLLTSNSAAASADETRGQIYQDVEIPRAGNYKVWVRYADWANLTENFVIRITQAAQERELFRHEFGARGYHRRSR